MFRTKNPLTFPVSGTGMAGMECIATNLLERGDEAIVCINGVFGTRMKDVMERCGATVHTVEATWGEVIALEQLQAALDAASTKTKLVGIVHAETSTGAHQPLEGLAEIVHGRGALLVVDAVTSLGGHELRIDEWGIDACYSGTQKCLSCPPGLSPVSFGPRALAAMDARKSKVQSWYLDVSMLRKYYTGGGGGGRVYHHTAPINMTYALHEALTIVLEEGIDAPHRQRHAADAAAAALGARGHGPPGLHSEALRCIRSTASASPPGPTTRACDAGCSRNMASRSARASARWRARPGASA